MRIDRYEWTLIGLIAFVLALIGLATWVAVVDQREWDAWASEHGCTVVARSNSRVATTVAPVFNANGGASVAVGTTTIAGTTTWLCDDGVEHTR